MITKRAIAQQFLPAQVLGDLDQVADAHSHNATAPSVPWEDLKFGDHPYITGTLIATVVLAVVTIYSIRYTLSIVKTLAMVESPKTTYILPEEKTSLGDTDVVIVKEAPLTSNIRRTVRHLKARGGRGARYRGASLAIFSTVLGTVLLNAFNLVSPRRFMFNGQLDNAKFMTLLCTLVVGITCDLAMALFGMTWTHVVISEPTSTWWIKRIPSLRVYKQISLPTAVRAVCERLVGLVPLWLLSMIPFNDMEGFSASSVAIVSVELVAVILIGFLIFIGLYIPSEVTLTRMRASMLPDNVETIVNVDRTFNGRVQPTILGGSGCVSFMGAWKSFDGEARLRLLRLYFKTFAIDVALHVFFGMVLLTQLYFFKGRLEN